MFIKKMNTIKKLLNPFMFLFTLLFFSISISTVLAADIDGFLIKTIPENFSVNEAVDLEINAVKNWEIVKNYDWIVFIVINGIDKSEYIIPNDGVYEFLPTDQGKKLFSKGLKIKKNGNFTLEVKEAINKNIKGQKSIIVKGKEKNSISTIDVISPVNWGTETDDSLNIIGSSFWLANTPIKIFLNNVVVGNTETDKNGEFSADISLVKTWENILELKAINISWEIIGKSKIVKFEYKKNEKTPIVSDINIIPWKEINKMDKVTIKIKTREDIKIAKIILWEKSYSMKKEKDGIFSTSMIAQKWGKIKIKFSLLDDGIEKIIDKNTIITVNDTNKWFTGNHESFSGDSDILTGETTIKKNNINSIGEVIINPKSIDWSEITMTRQNSGDAKKFMINYGIEKTTLEQNTIIDTNAVNVPGLDPEKTYYFQITPLNEKDQKDWTPSNIIEYNFWGISAKGKTSCKIENIIIKKEKIDGKNYLTWTSSENIEKYEIYRTSTANSKTSISDMEKIGETKDNKFEYPFDINSKEDKFAYYAIQGICKDGQKIQVGNIEKVKVWPFDNLLIIFILSWLIFSMYKLYKLSS